MFLFKLCCGTENTPPKNIKQKNQTQSKHNSKHFKSKRIKQDQSQQNPYESKPFATDKIIPSNTQNRYEGEQFRDNPHGNGKMLYANGDFYRGEWVNGIKEGRGLQVFQELGQSYEGEWHNNYFDGHGKLTYNNNSYYVGEFKEGKKDGSGQYYDVEKKKVFNEEYQKDVLKEQIEVSTQKKSKQEQFPTLALDKERFNTQDLIRYENNNPEIKEVQIVELLKFYELNKVIKLPFLCKKMKEWTIKEVLDFLSEIDLQQYKQVFYKNKIKGKDLISLTDKELKEDLKMKLGSRKRFINFISFFNEKGISLERRSSKMIKSKKTKKKNLYKLRSVQSMKKLLKKVETGKYFENSIKEESSEHKSNEDQQFYTNNIIEENPSQDQSFGRIYESQQISVNTYSKNKDSYESIIEPNSERSSSSEKSIKKATRKQSKDEKQNNSIVPLHFFPHVNSKHHERQSFNNLKFRQNDTLNKEVKERKSQREKDISPSKKSSSSSSSSSDIVVPGDLQRKKTALQSTHGTSEIRQLYEFLKEHNSLDFLIKQKDIQNLEPIGQGGYGKVYKAKYVGSQIAVKDYRKTGQKHRQDFKKEVEVISDLKHPNIVLYMGMCITADKFLLITQFMENGSLFDQLHKKKKQFQPFQQVEIIHDIVKGMVYLHNRKKIIHRDLKTSNILLDDDWKVKLCDFGLSGHKRRKKSKKKKNRMGTFQWMAPEVIRNQGIDFWSDVYSFGVIIWELLSEKIPYAGMTEQQIIGTVGYDETHILEQPEGNQFLIYIMKKCLTRDCEKRPNFMTIQDQFEKYMQNFEMEQTPLFNELYQK